MNPTVGSDEVQAMLRACAPDATVSCHESGAIARRNGLEFPFLPPCAEAHMIRVPLGTVELLVEALEINRECACGELPILDPN